jgi:hypothetical protein
VGRGGRALSTSSDDERHLVIGGRKWRRQDPALPEDVRAELLSQLGRGRSGVRAAKQGGDAERLRGARRRVDLAKHGLGERGDPWWEQDAEQRRARWEGALSHLRSLDD